MSFCLQFIAVFLFLLFDYHTFKLAESVFIEH